MKTYSLKPTDIKRQWYLLDAAQASMGRVASFAARLLLGKDKPNQSPHMDSGDFVVIINAKDTKFTGNKGEKKIYYRHSGFPGGLKQKTLNEAMAQDPTYALRHAIRGMLPPNKLRTERLKRLKIYPEAEHPHRGQNPKEISLPQEAK
ncbi:MAG: 50S ribosomal protein L13 [Candidatus Saccharimonadales bacterium]